MRSCPANSNNAASKGRSPRSGLGIFFDTFQNIDHQHHHKHPYIYAVVNDGTLQLRSLAALFPPLTAVVTCAPPAPGSLPCAHEGCFVDLARP